MNSNESNNDNSNTTSNSNSGNHKNDLFCGMNDKEFLNKCLNDSKFISKYDFSNRSQKFLYNGYNRGNRLICCLLCRRKFKTIDDLKNHDSMSLLHESNLIKWMKKKIQNDVLNDDNDDKDLENGSIFLRNISKKNTSNNNSNNTTISNNGSNGNSSTNSNSASNNNNDGNSKNNESSYVLYILCFLFEMILW